MFFSFAALWTPRFFTFYIIRCSKPNMVFWTLPLYICRWDKVFIIDSLWLCEQIRL